MKWRKDKILEFIEANYDCTKTELNNSMAKHFAENTTKKELKELIEVDKTVLCSIDENNPRVHHLCINTKVMYALKNLEPMISKVKERIKLQNFGDNLDPKTRYTCAQVIGTPLKGAGMIGRVLFTRDATGSMWAICAPHGQSLSFNFSDPMSKLAAMASGIG